MASIHHKGEAWHCQFVYHGKRHTFSLGKVTQDEAETKANQVNYLLMRLKQNLLQLPPGIDIVTFISFDGKPPHATSESEVLTLGGLRDRYLETHRNGSLEQSTLDGIELHFRHLVGTLGEKFPVPDLSLPIFSSTPTARKKKGPEREETLPGDDQQRNRHPPDGMELGRAHGAADGQISDQRTAVSPLQRETTVHGVGRGRAEDSGADRGRGEGMVGLPLSAWGRDLSVVDARESEGDQPWV